MMKWKRVQGEKLDARRRIPGSGGPKAIKLETSRGIKRGSGVGSRETTLGSSTWSG
jgi:hypothetical protein